jgi:hypothetical protein
VRVPDVIQDAPRQDDDEDDEPLHVHETFRAHDAHHVHRTLHVPDVLMFHETFRVHGALLPHETFHDRELLKDGFLHLDVQLQALRAFDPLEDSLLQDGEVDFHFWASDVRHAKYQRVSRQLHMRSSEKLQANNCSLIASLID